MAGIPLYDRGFNTGLANPNLMARVLQSLQSRSNFVDSRVDGPTIPSSVPSALSPVWPTFNNEAERNIALATGSYDPTFASPLKRTEYTTLEAARVKDLTDASAKAQAAIPLDPTGTDEQILAAQLAGDMHGDTKRILHSLQTGAHPKSAMGYEQSLFMPPEMRPKLRPFIPRSGFGGVPSEAAITSNLDTDLLSDPEFKRISFQDPTRGAHVYRSLTGREYEGDVKLHDKIRGRQADFGRSVVMEELKAGAYRDPATGSWMVWETREAPEGGITAGGVNAPKPFRQLVKANPEKQRIMDTYYSSVTGQRITQLPSATAGQQAGAAQLMEDPAMAAIFEQRKQELNRELTPQEKMTLAYLERNKSQPVSGFEHFLNKAATAGEYVKDAGSGIADALMWPLRQIPDPRQVSGIGR